MVGRFTLPDIHSQVSVVLSELLKLLLLLVLAI